MTEYIKINNRVFRKEKCADALTLKWYKNDAEGAWYDQIYSVYNRPSCTKVSIWHSWCKWLYQVMNNGGTGYLTIASHNCHFFTIEGWVANDETESECVPIYITYAHNRAYM